MKNLNKKIFILLSLSFLSGCGLVNNHFAIFHTFKTALPHSHKVKLTGENSFPQNGKSVVSLNFKTNRDEGVETIWRRINDDKTFSDAINLTYLDIFKDERLESMIEPGAYFLDGIKFADNKKIAMVGGLRDFLSKKQKGWNEEKNEPLWFQFEVRAGQKIFIPDVIVSARCKSGSNSCSDEDFVMSMKISDLEKQNLIPYKLGYDIEKN